MPIKYLAQDTISDLDSEIDNIESEYSEKQDELEKKKLEYDEILDELTKITSEKEETTKDIETTKNNIVEKQAEIKDLTETQIPEMKDRAKTSIKFAQMNNHENITIEIVADTLGSEDDSSDILKRIENTNRFIKALNDNVANLSELIDKAEQEKKNLETEKDNLELEKVELEQQEAYVKEAQAQLSEKISSIESEADAAQEELEAKKELQKIYSEAGCGPNDVYGVDCAQDKMISASGFARPMRSGVVTNEFGGWNMILGDGAHSGIDIAGSTGAAVYPAAPGKVIYSGSTSDGGGNSVIMIHVVNGKNYITRYAHLNSTNVTTGQSIPSIDTQIGGVGQTGAATGPHLHFEIEQQSSYIWSALENPRNYIDFPPIYVPW